MPIPKKTMTEATVPLETGLFALPPDDRDSRIVARHYGLDGNGGANFQKVGDEFELTRERVRQIVAENALLRYRKTGAVSTLARVISSIISTLPSPAADVEMTLRAEGLTLRLFRLEGVLAIAELLGCPAPFRVTQINGVRYAVAVRHRPFQDILTEARQIVRRNGMATIASCISGRSKTGISQRELDLAEVLLSAEPGFQWLLPGSGWFWFSTMVHNRAADRIRKMLAVANPLNIGELRNGLSRMGDPLAPKKILLEFCRHLPGLSVYGDTVGAETEIRLDEVLNKTERDIFKLLSEHNGCMANSELIRGSRTLGIKRPTFYQCVTYSPIVSRYNRSYYRLIGSRLHKDDGGAPGSRFRLTSNYPSGVNATL